MAVCIPRKENQSELQRFNKPARTHTHTHTHARVVAKIPSKEQGENGVEAQAG